MSDLRLSLASGLGSITPDPLLTPGLLLWLPPENIVQVAGTITAWTDASGNGNHTTVVSNPAYEANALDGRPAADLSANITAGNRYFALPNVFTTLTSAEIFFVVRQHALNAVAYGLHSLTASGAGNRSGYGISIGTNHYEPFGSTTRPENGDPTVVDVTTFHLYNCRSAANAWSCHFDNTQQKAAVVNTVGFGTDPRIGSSIDAPFGGHIVEVVGPYNHVLTTTERANVKNYVKLKYPSLSL